MKTDINDLKYNTYDQDLYISKNLLNFTNQEEILIQRPLDKIKNKNNF